MLLFWLSKKGVSGLLGGRIHSLEKLSHSQTPLEKLEEGEARASKGGGIWMRGERSSLRH